MGKCFPLTDLFSVICLRQVSGKTGQISLRFTFFGVQPRLPALVL